MKKRMKITVRDRIATIGVGTLAICTVYFFAWTLKKVGWDSRINDIYEKTKALAFCERCGMAYYRPGCLVYFQPPGLCSLCKREHPELSEENSEISSPYIDAMCERNGLSMKEKTTDYFCPQCGVKLNRINTSLGDYYPPVKNTRCDDCVLGFVRGRIKDCQEKLKKGEK